jgi:hypothetical protein
MDGIFLYILQPLDYGQSIYGRGMDQKAVDDFGRIWLKESGSGGEANPLPSKLPRPPPYPP